MSNCALVWGAANIGQVIGKSERETFYMLSKGLLPADKAGASWVARRDKLEDPSRWPKAKKAGAA